MLFSSILASTVSHSSRVMKTTTHLASILLFLRFFILFSSAIAASDASSNSTTHVPSEAIVLLDCGSSGASIPDGNRNWTGDTGSIYAPNSANSITAPAPYQDTSLPSQVPYMTARIFTSSYTYSFPVRTSSQYFVRLYFYPVNYTAGYNIGDSLFSVTAGNFTLLSNFSAYDTAAAKDSSYLILEYFLQTTTPKLDLTFTPSGHSRDSYAFVNGIEIVSSPDLFPTNITRNLVTGSGLVQYAISADAAFQTMYRLNVGGNVISPTSDSGSLFRSWESDNSYIQGAAFGVIPHEDPNITYPNPPLVPAYVAPEEVYETARSMGTNAQINLNYNLTWILPVDAGFYYVIRLHFCEIDPGITEGNQRVFYIYLNNLTAEKQADVIYWAGGRAKPTYKEYVVSTAGSGPMNVWVALHPNLDSGANFTDAILNGLEVFKLANTSNSLAGFNPPVPTPQSQPQPQEQPVSKSSHSGVSIGVVVGSVVGGLVFLAGCVFCIVALHRRPKRKEVKDLSGSDTASQWLPLSMYDNSRSAVSAKSGTTRSHSSRLPVNACRRFTFEEIKAATKNFDQALLLGIGGFGKVYCGEIEGGRIKVAVKRGSPSSEQGIREFQTEIEMLSMIRHRHLVSLIGYCTEKTEMILVYDYMANGTLREHLYNTNNPPLTWKQRLEICIGAARGLHYLHTGAKHNIIHRDVKTTNILLDDKWVAKVSDFGLSKAGPTLDQSHVSTTVKGSFGYLDPEYFLRQQLTEKSDVYSFGVVLFEVLAARPTVNHSLPMEQVSLAQWAIHCLRNDAVDQIIDPYLQGKITPQCLRKFVETAEKCLAEEGINRPSMGDVLWNLEFALQLQEGASSGDGVTTEGRSSKENELDEDPLQFGSTTTTTTMASVSVEDASLVSELSSSMSPAVVFSQMINPAGR